MATCGSPRGAHDDDGDTGDDGLQRLEGDGPVGVREDEIEDDAIGAFVAGNLEGRFERTCAEDLDMTFLLVRDQALQDSSMQRGILDDQHR
jgi:hypothetical protein